MLILFGVIAFIIGGDFVAIDGSNVTRLDLVGAGIVPYIMWLYLVLYATGIFGVHTKRRLISGIAFVAAFFMLALPTLILDLGSTKIRLSDHPTPETMASFKAAYPVRYVSYSASSEGSCLLVRKHDYSPQMESFIQELIQKQSRTSASSQPLTAPDFCGNFRIVHASIAVTPHASRPAVRGG